MGLQPLFALLNGTALVGLLLSVHMYVCYVSALGKCMVMCMQVYNVCPYSTFLFAMQFIILYYTMHCQPRKLECSRRGVTILVNLCE